jgi:hypothetical protein
VRTSNLIKISLPISTQTRYRLNSENRQTTTSKISKGLEHILCSLISFKHVSCVWSCVKHAIIHWPLTTKVQAQSQASLCGICSGQISNGAGFPTSSLVFLSVSFRHCSTYLFIHPLCHITHSTTQYHTSRRNIYLDMKHIMAICINKLHPPPYFLAPSNPALQFNSSTGWK